MTDNNSWPNNVTNIAQLGGIETAVLDNGPSRGTRIAWVNTGSGLRYKVVIDRALDIADASFCSHNLAWLSAANNLTPCPPACYPSEFLGAFFGGLLTTCGLTNVGPEDVGDSGRRPAHGHINHIPATVESIVQPDLRVGRTEMSITAVTSQAPLFGPQLSLRRTISSKLGKPAISVRDTVTNCGNVASPHMILYHLNFGWPIIDDGTRILWKGNCVSRGNEMDKEIFSGSRDCKTCLPAQQMHRGSREAVGFIDVEADKDGFCEVGFMNEELSLAVSIRYRKEQLPCLTNWQHWGPGEYVTALEPGNCHPIGQSQTEKSGTIVILEPGETASYEMTLTVYSDMTQIQSLRDRIDR